MARPIASQFVALAPASPAGHPNKTPYAAAVPRGTVRLSNPHGDRPSTAVERTATTRALETTADAGNADMNANTKPAPRAENASMAIDPSRDFGWRQTR